MFCRPKWTLFTENVILTSYSDVDAKGQLNKSCMHKVMHNTHMCMLINSTHMHPLPLSVRMCSPLHFCMHMHTLVNHRIAHFCSILRLTTPVDFNCSGECMRALEQYQVNLRIGFELLKMGFPIKINGAG